MARQPIPAYALYGEAARGPFPDPLHVETIDARSRIHGWRIRPHRHLELHQVFLLLEGGAEAALDGTTQPLAAPVLLRIPPLAVHGFRFEPSTLGWVASLPSRSLARAVQDRTVRGAMDRIAATRLQPDDAAGLASMFRAALDAFRSDRPGRADCLAAHAAILAVAAVRCATVPLPGSAKPGSADPASDLVGRYLALVEAEFAMPLPLEVRARRLGVSAPQLSRQCRKLLGRSALEVLHDRIVLEARRHLVYTSMTVAQVADALGFSDPAYFSRFFAQRVGTSPSRYRQSVFEASPD